MEPQVHLAAIAVAPVLPSKAALGDFGLTIDRVRFVVVRPPSDTLADTTLALPPGATELALELRVPLVAFPEILNVSVVALAGAIPLFTGTRAVSVPTPPPPPEIPVTTYIGPAADSVVILPRTPFILLNDSLRLQVLAFNAGAPVTQVYVAWSTSDATAAPINVSGVLRAPGSRGIALVRVRTPSGATDSVTATFTPPATQLLAFAGGGQIDTVGQLLAVPLEVLARAADGLGVGGVPVHFRALSGGGSVTDSVVVTDGAGHARTTVTLGGLPGGQTFEAAAPGLSPATFGVVALAGLATQLLALAGDGQLATVATALLTRPAVQLKDAGGNPVAGASVTFAVSGGGGSLTGGTQLTNAAGVATVGSWTLGTLAGPNTLTASAPGVTPVVFSATGVAGAGATIVKVVGDLQSAIVNTIVPFTPQVRILDQFGNPVSGTTVSAAISLGGGSVTNSAPVSDSSGTASVGTWRLGTLVGSNALTVSGTGLAGSPITFTATGLVDVPSQMVVFAGDGQSALIGNAVSINPAVRVSDQYGNAVGGVAVTFAIGLGNGIIGTPATVTTDTAGIAKSPTWTLGPVAGANTLGATATGLPAVTFNAQGITSLASTIATQAGNGQTGIVGTALPTPYGVIVKNLAGAPVAGVPVSWSVGAGGGTIAPAQSTTNGAGIATAIRTLGTVAGTQTATASVGGLTGSPVMFTATALPDVPAQLVKLSQDPQSAIVGTIVTSLPSVRVVDQFANAIAGVGGVTFAVLTGGGSVTGATQATNAQGVATVGSWTIGTAAGLSNNSLTASVSGLLQTFTASGVVGAPAQLAFLTEPTHGLAGNTVAPPVQVAIRDQFGNLALPAKDVVSLRLGPTSPPGNLVGTADSAAVSGVATFPGLSIDAPGLGYTLVATSGSLATAETKPFDVGGVTGAIPVTQGPVAAAFDVRSKKLYLPGSGGVSVLLNDKEITRIPGFESPIGVAANSTTNQVYVSSLAGLVVIDGSRTPDVIRLTIQVGAGAQGVAVNEQANLVYVAASDPVKGGPALVPVDGSKDATVLGDVVALPAPGAGVAFNPNNGFVYVVIPARQSLIVIDPKPGSARIVDEFLGMGKGTHSVAIDVQTNMAYVTNRDERSVSIVDLTKGTEQRLAVGNGPEGLGVDSQRRAIYVANNLDGTVSFIDADRQTVFATLIVGPAPKAAAVNPLTGQVYLPTFTDSQVRVVQP